MEFKKLIIVLTITITITIGIMFGVSYGWYAYSSAKTEVTSNTIEKIPTVIFTKNEFIYSTITAPIYDEDRYQYANKNSFIVTVGSNLADYDVGLQILLNDIKMSNELKIANYKYELLKDGITISKGDFSTLGNNTSLVLSPMTQLNITNYPETYKYELYIWLSENNTNQNNLMNKKFSAKINVNSAMKRK